MERRGKGLHRLLALKVSRRHRPVTVRDGASHISVSLTRKVLPLQYGLVITVSQSFRPCSEGWWLGLKDLHQISTISPSESGVRVPHCARVWLDTMIGLGTITILSSAQLDSFDACPRRKLPGPGDKVPMLAEG
ncbi:hypothetical protein RRG08_017581 [Elysia crispata]|uniref:Uncharacterized protein n=1 Tax=Elysia crispata TaxID=231223 RepID=A0AAE0YDB5_9GAST|nr:hypothetical protein RRG08_017581 [Elysia crispata]